jgi:hypothetical protein
MPGFTEGVSTVNSFLRTIIALAVLGGFATAGWVGYTKYNQREMEARAREKELAEATDKLVKVRHDLDSARGEIAFQAEEIRRQNAEIAKLNENIAKLETALTLLKVDHRVAKLTAVDQTTDESSGEMSTLVDFVELNDEGQPMDTPRQFRIRGDVVFIDNWIVKFDDKYVQENDIERGTSLVLFRRIFGERQQPIEGFPLDAIGSAPRAYQRGSKMSDFEKRIWDDFWAIANDPTKAEELGIRAAHGQAVSMKVQKGKSYRVDLRASDGLSIVPEESSE